MTKAQAKTIPEDQSWHLYIIRCRQGQLYTGITTDVERRFNEHQSNSVKCAKYLRGKQPLTLVYTTSVNDKSDALQLEYKIKKLSALQKKALILGQRELPQ